MVGSYSLVHWERTRRRVMLDLPQPPSPQMVMVMRCWSSILLVWGEEMGL
jgi:hypothetical protein